MVVGRNSPGVIVAVVEDESGSLKLRRAVVVEEVDAEHQADKERRRGAKEKQPQGYGFWNGPLTHAGDRRMELRRTSRARTDGPDPCEASPVADFFHALLSL